MLLLHTYLPVHLSGTSSRQLPNARPWFFAVYILVSKLEPAPACVVFRYICFSGVFFVFSRRNFIIDGMKSAAPRPPSRSVWNKRLTTPFFLFVFYIRRISISLALPLQR